MTYLVGVDVGTGSARAGLFDCNGLLIASSSHNIKLFTEPDGIVEQSSADIWQAVCASTRGVINESGIGATEVSGIGFDATCSLVVVGEGGQSLSVSDSGDSARDIIVWMDHRATEQARRINSTGHAVLAHVGGAVSPEMQTPKLLWLKEHMPEVFSQAWQFFDLADYLTWRATGSLTRSLCTLTCKWTYLGHEERWDPSFFHSIGLSELAEEGFARIGTQAVAPGTRLPADLGFTAASELGLSEGCAVAAGIIDAHAGGVGTVGVTLDGGNADACGVLAYVFGTSSCTMSSSREPVFVPGVWGPYFSAMVPGLWLNEGGQSVAGAAMDRLVEMHPAAATVRSQAKANDQQLLDWLADEAASLCVEPSDAVMLSQTLHVVPEFLGNRSPLPNPASRAIIAGLDMRNDLSSLVALYVAGICSVGYGLRQIIDAQRESGLATQVIVISGGAGRHPLVRQLLSDATGLPLVVTACEEPVTLGAAMLGAVACGAYADVPSAMSGMTVSHSRLEPTDGSMRERHTARYAVFLELQGLSHRLTTAE